MLSPKEKRFKRYWEEQRSAGKWSFILVFTLGISLIVFFLPLIVSLVIDIYSFLHLYELRLWQAILLALVISFAISQFLWMRNEDRWRSLMKKEAKPDASVY